MTIAKKKYLGYALGIAAALLVSAPALLGGALDASAQALSADELFGGAADGGSAFASSAGLGEKDLVDTIASIIRVALGFLGIIAVIIILLGGFKWMTSQGNDTKVADAKKLIYAGIIGIVIVLSAYAIANFVITKIAGVTQAGGGGVGAG
ncbi:hypothetical protein FJZ23_02905 [Candidatus Parcubacteria bacterium]|nr:hypothetical protein [Candidatus Parcubacteria bacterium]